MPKGIITRSPKDHTGPGFTQYKYRREIQNHCNPAKLLAEAATTGWMPSCNPDGTPTGEHLPLNIPERIDILKLLLNKLVAAPKPVLAAPGDAQMGALEEVAKASAALFIEQAEAKAQAIQVQPLPVGSEGEQPTYSTALTVDVTTGERKVVKSLNGTEAAPKAPPS